MGECVCVFWVRAEERRGGRGEVSWRLQTAGKFTATTRVVKGEIDKTDTRERSVDLGQQSKRIAQIMLPPL